MKKIFIATIIMVSLIATISFNYGKIMISLNPSEEMKRLEQIENNLALPEPFRRYANDDGYETDWKGAHTYRRDIVNDYEDKNLINRVKEKVENDGWILDQASDGLLGGINYSYKNDKIQTKDYQTRIYITISPETMSDPRVLGDEHSIRISSVVNN